MREKQQEQDLDPEPKTPQVLRDQLPLWKQAVTTADLVYFIITLTVEIENTILIMVQFD